MYSFTIIFRKTKRLFCIDDCRYIMVKNICILGKKNKFEGLIKSKYVDKMEGGFKKIAGSNTHPILSPESDMVKIHVKNFPYYPNLIFDFDENKELEYIEVINIVKER